MLRPAYTRMMTPLVRRTLATAAGGSEPHAPGKRFKLVVVGAGPGGLSVSSTLSRVLGKGNVAVVDPATYHYYQPMFTYVGGGLKTLEEARFPMNQVMPPQVEWIQQAVARVDPDKHSVTLQSGETISYEYLVVAAGIQLDWDKVKGLKDAVGKDMVASNYSPDTVEKTWQFIQEFRGGNAVFTFPNTPIKCPGAPTKIVFLAEEAFRRNGVRDKTNMIYNTSLGKIFGVDHYGAVLQRLANERNIAVNFQTELIEVRPSDREAVFRNVATQALTTLHYDFLHAVPPQGPPDFLKESKLGDASGFVDVDKATLRHKRYPNVFAIGDCSNLPTSKTAAAITAQSGVLKQHLMADMQGRKEHAEYDGYTSCPLIVGREELILAEFSGYTGRPLETFPVDQRQISKMAQYLNKEIIPEIYWSGLLKGYWTGPSLFRKAMAPLRQHKPDQQ